MDEIKRGGTVGAGAARRPSSKAPLQVSQPPNVTAAPSRPTAPSRFGHPTQAQRAALLSLDSLGAGPRPNWSRRGDFGTL